MYEGFQRTNTFLRRTLLHLKVPVYPKLAVNVHKMTLHLTMRIGLTSCNVWQDSRRNGDSDKSTSKANLRHKRYTWTKIINKMTT